MNKDNGFTLALDRLLRGARCVDLSQTIHSGMPKWSTHGSILVEKLAVHERDGYYNQGLRLTEHSGTHVDAPAHTQPMRMADTVDHVPPGYLLAPAVVYDLRPLNLKAGEAAGAEEFLELEERSGERVGAGEIALFCFGWDRYWDPSVEVGFYSLNAPGLAPSVCRLLLERGVRAAGSDTMAFDSAMIDGKGVGESAGHQLLLGNGILLVENLKSLTELPSRCYFMALPLKIKEGSGSPIRAVAFCDIKEGADER